MTRVIVWKELREQGAIVLALLVMGCGLIAGLSVIATPQQERGFVESLFAASVLGVALLAGATGAVIGATLFAGEREAGTFPFLDRRPATRWQLWWRKVAAGLALAAVPASGYFVTALVAAPIDGGGVLSLLFGGGTYFGFAWGCVGSVLRRTALGACAVGQAIGVAVVGVAIGFGAIVLEVADGLRPREPFAILELAVDGVALFGILSPIVAAFVLPLLLSARLFTAPDREQDVAGPRPLTAFLSGRQSRAKRFAWLLVRQHRVNIMWLTAATAVAGCVLLIPDVLFITAWPAMTLVVGVLVGVVLFADEQGTEAARFWGERRLRVGGVWGAKLAFGFALTFGLLVLMLLPCVVRGLVDSFHRQEAFSRAFRTGVPSPGFPFLTFLFVGPAYGLACGQLAALLFRKPIVALAVGAMVGGTAVALWFPSLLGGGLHGWQVFTPVAVTLIVSRRLTWPWATDTLGQRGPVLRLASGLVAVALTFAGGIAWRVLEIPEVAEANDDIAFAKSLPTYDENESGRGIRRAVAEFGTRSAPHVQTRSDISTPDRPLLMNELFTMLLQSGYPENRPDVDSLLKILDGEWEQTLLEASRKPTGVFIDPAEHARDYDNPQDQYFTVFPRMATVYALRGLKAQRDGDPADFANRVGVLLAAVRTTRTSGPPMAVMTANSVEEATFRGVHHWLKALRGHPELLRQVLTTLLDHERVDTYTPRRTELASQVALRNGITGPGSWLPRTLALLGGPSREEADVIAFAWAVPWEKERLRRAVGYGNVPAVASSREGNPYLRGAPGLWMYDFLRGYRRQFADNEVRLVSLRGCLLQVALRLHEAEAGRFPTTLNELVPKYLPGVPIDPFTLAPAEFRYRVSVGGESIAVEPVEYLTTPDVGPIAPAFAAAAGRPSLIPAVGALAGSDVPLPPSTDTQRRVTREVAAGQPVVWSVGLDHRDDGGRVSVSGDQPRGSVLAGDIVFVVPLPAKAKSP